MNRRATAGRPYRLTTGFWVVLRCLARPEQMPKTHINCPFWFGNDIPANEPAGDHRSPLQAYNGVSGGTCRGGLRPPARGKCPKRILITRSGFANDIPANEPAGDRRSPLQAYNGVLGGTCRGGLRPPARGKCPKRVLIARLGLLTIFPRKDRRATAGRPYRLTTGGSGGACRGGLRPPA
jgi:hypothetical protein